MATEIGRGAMIFSLALATSSCGSAKDARPPSKPSNTFAPKNAPPAAKGKFKVVITGNGLHSGSDTNYESVADCAEFRVTQAHVEDFFKRAENVESQFYNHELNNSLCYASGDVWLANGRHGKWTIDKSRRGYLVYADGSVQYMFCRSCVNSRFLPVSDVLEDYDDPKND